MTVFVAAAARGVFLFFNNMRKPLLDGWTRHREEAAMRWMDRMWDFSTRLRGLKVREQGTTSTTTTTTTTTTKIPNYTKKKTFRNHKSAWILSPDPPLLFNQSVDRCWTYRAAMHQLYYIYKYLYHVWEVYQIGVSPPPRKLFLCATAWYRCTKLSICHTAVPVLLRCCLERG